MPKKTVPKASVENEGVYRFQRYDYFRTKKSGLRVGIAKVKHFDDVSDVEWIVDAETGKLVPTVWSYYLISGPLSYIGVNVSA